MQNGKANYNSAMRSNEGAILHELINDSIHHNTDGFMWLWQEEKIEN